MTDIIAHRGCAGEYPENTIYAVEQVAPHVDCIEFDIRRCASGELVVFHDAELDRLTEASGPLAETPWAKLRELEVLESGHGIPRLDALVQAVPPDVGIDVELKEPGLVGDVRSRLEDEEHEITLTANDPTVLAELNTVAPSTPRGFVFWEAPGESLELASEWACDVVAIEYTLCLQHDLIERAHAAGFDVWAWTVVDRAAVEELRAVGVDGLIVDRLDIL